MNKKHQIEVREYRNGTSKYSIKPEFVIVEVINRVIFAEQIGNFNPIFCRYRNNPRKQISSDMGDVSDPFRVSPDYANHLFITI